MSVLTRRKFIEVAGLTTALGSSLGFTSKGVESKNFKTSTNTFAPVNVSPSRVIRTVVGLRPYRSSGFVVKSERVNNKTIIHNYGHGGAGITLSWGTAKLAVDLALKTNQKRFAVLGCGVIGLSTARELQRNGFQVTIYAKNLPPQTTSNIAGGLWLPTSVFDKSKAGSNFLSQFDSACRISHRTFQDFVGSDYGVSWLNEFSLGMPAELPPTTDLYPNIKEHRDAKNYFGFDYVNQFSTMLIEPPIYLNALLRDFYLAGGQLTVRSFESIKDITSLTEAVIMNCTGLGAGKLFNDTELEPVRGQLSILLPQPEVDYSYSGEVNGNFIYMIPRKDGIVLGGTFQHGNWSTDPTKEDSEMILNTHGVVAKGLDR
ncbi:MAG TPA: FAD-dependent oxidoreductase [Chryseolinea sp.]|nr:FAD-dependent oxidoreductase [Chryseolinea sp.]